MQYYNDIEVQKSTKEEGWNAKFNTENESQRILTEKKFVNLEGVDNELNTKYECLSKWRSLKQFDAIVEQKLDVTLHIRQIER